MADWLGIGVSPTEFDIGERKGKEKIIVHLFGNGTFEVLMKLLDEKLNRNSDKEI